MENECFKPSSMRGSAGSPSVTKDRVVRPFEWGLDWIPENGHRVQAPPLDDVIGDWVSHVMADTDAFFTPPPTSDYTLRRRPPTATLLTFPSALVTPHRDEQHGALPVLPTARRSLDGRPRSDRRRRRARAAAVELRCRAATSGCASCWRGTA